VNLSSIKFQWKSDTKREAVSKRFRFVVPLEAILHNSLDGWEEI
jgi:hypothetical protein